MPTQTLTGLAVEFHNIPGAMMRVLNCFTRRGLVLEAVYCAPFDNRHRAQVIVDTTQERIDQIVRELESTVGVERITMLDRLAAERLLHAPSA